MHTQWLKVKEPIKKTIFQRAFGRKRWETLGYVVSCKGFFFSYISVCLKNTVNNSGDINHFFSSGGVQSKMFICCIFILSPYPAAKHGGETQLNPHRAERRGKAWGWNTYRRTQFVADIESEWGENIYWGSRVLNRSVGGRAGGEIERHGGVLLLLSFKWISRHVVWLSLSRLNWASRDKRGNIIIQSLSVSLSLSFLHYINTSRECINTMAAQQQPIYHYHADVHYHHRWSHMHTLTRDKEQRGKQYWLNVLRKIYNSSIVISSWSTFFWLKPG